MLRTIIFEGQEIAYEVRRKKMKKVRVQVANDLTVSVVAPQYATEAQLQEVVQEKAQWILAARERQRVRAEENAPYRLINSYKVGGRIAYLGAYLPLAVTGTTTRAGYLLASDCLWVDGGSETQIRAQVEQFYRRQSMIVFEEIHQQIYPLLAATYDLPKAELTVRKMTASWGRCHLQKQRIVLNWQLIRATPACIRSVLMHEYVHFKHPNHSRAFYEMLYQLEPDYAQLSHQLSTMVDLRA